ncbi:hypothetical protein D3C84_731090 [compost metagenome]
MQRPVILPAEPLRQSCAVQLGTLVQQISQFVVGQFLIAQQTPAMFMAGAVLVSAVAFLTTGETKQSLMAEIVSKTHRRQRIQFAGWRQCQQMPKPDQIQMSVGMLRRRVTKVRRQTVHARRANILPARIRQQHSTAQLLQGFAQGTCRGVGADDQKAAGRRFGDFQQARQWPGRGTLQHHRADDHRKRQRHQQQRAFESGLIQANGENRRNRRRHDSARCDP